MRLGLRSGISNLAPRQNVLKLILKSPRFVPFGANLAHFGWQICHPYLRHLLSVVPRAIENGNPRINLSPAGEWLHLTVNWELIIHNALRMTSSRALVHSSLKQRTDRLTPWSGLEWRFGTNIEPKCINLIWKCLGFVQFRAFLNVFVSKSVITESLTISHQLDQALS